MDILNKFGNDWRKIKVLGGDFTAGEWNLSGGMMTPDVSTGSCEIISLMGEISKLQIQTEESVRDLAKTLGLAAGGLIVAGPIGAALGFFAAGQRKEVCVLCELKDGKKFLATMDQRIYQQLLGMKMMGEDI